MAPTVSVKTGPCYAEVSRKPFGCIHSLGLYAIPGGEWNNKTYHGAAEWLKAWAKVPTTDWLELMKQWNPQQFDAKKWAKMAKEMGVKYVKITTKHHEGFCLWPSKYTEYTVANTLTRKISWENW